MKTWGYNGLLDLLLTDVSNIFYRRINSLLTEKCKWKLKKGRIFARLYYELVKINILTGSTFSADFHGLSTKQFSNMTIQTFKTSLKQLKAKIWIASGWSYEWSSKKRKRWQFWIVTEIKHSQVPLKQWQTASFP